MIFQAGSEQIGCELQTYHVIPQDQEKINYSVNYIEAALHLGETWGKEEPSLGLIDRSVGLRW